MVMRFEKYQMGINETDVCRQFGFINSTIQRISENRTKIISAFEQNGPRIKRF
jgi:hypothetical protein